MIYKRMIAVTLAAAVAAGCLSGCSGGKTEDKTSTTESAAEQTAGSQAEKLPETDEEWHDAMIAKSLTSYGNVTKMQEKLAAAQNGEQLNISYLGGSITEGLTAGPDKCWAKLTYEHIAEKFGTGDNVAYNNAGISGTPSKLGILRLQRDVLSTDPDICFVEFAVNDGMEADYQSAYESIIRTLIENDVAVVLVFARTEEGHTCQEYMQKQGEYYGLPMISYSDALVYMFDNGKMTWQDFSDDQSHPNEYGHTLVAEMVDNYFDTVMDQTADEYIYPTIAMTETREYGAKLCENTDIEPDSMGSWKTGTEVAKFANGWAHPRETGENEPLIFKFSGKSVYLLYEEVNQGKLGKAHIKITADGELYDEIEIDPITPSGWGNCQTQRIALSGKVKDYEIEISMAEGDEDKYFAVLGLAYAE